MVSVYPQTQNLSFTPIPLRSRSCAEVAAELPKNLLRADFVYVRRGGVLPTLAAKYEGPYKVLERSDKFLFCKWVEKRDSVSVDRLKPYTAAGSVSPAAPPRRGRPPLLATPAAQ
jgi:hypothetical protein